MNEQLSLDTLSELAFAESRRLADDGNVTAVAAGIKLRDGKPAGGWCLQYLVKKKLPAAAPPAEWRLTSPLPVLVQGVPTDVIEVGEVSRSVSDLAAPVGPRATRMAEPLAGGYATATLSESVIAGGGYGTLAGICFDATSFAPLGLSNAHVWGPVAGTEAIQPVYPASALSTNVTPLTNASGPSRSDIPRALRPAIAFANAGAWAHLVTGLDAGDPVVFGQNGTGVPAGARTDTETVSVAVAVAPGQAPAGRALSHSVSWAYQRLSSVAELDAATTADRTNDHVLGVQKVTTDFPTYAGTKTVKITAEVAGPGAAVASWPQDRLVVAHLVPQPAADKVVRRLLRLVAGQALPTAGKGFQFAGTVSTTELAKGTWAVSVFVQHLTTGVTESANVNVGANGVAVVVADCTFTVT
jgi:hypothetical protein